MLHCFQCGKTFDEASLLWRCPCGGVLDWTVPEPFKRSSIRTEETGMWRYAASLPLDSPDSRVSMGEGGTPLIPGDWNGLSVFWKLDFLCPTGSYKDRGMACLVNRLRELGVRELIEDSSGNAGSSMAARILVRSALACAGVRSSSWASKLVAWLHAAGTSA